MEVILLEKIHKLGNLGDKVRVRAGYGRNYLIPQKRAVPATPDNVEKFEAQRGALELAQTDARAAAQARVDAITDLTVTISAKAGDEGKLYGSIGNVEIAAAISAAGGKIDKREVRLLNGPLREIGEHQVTVHLHADVETLVTVQLVAEDAIVADSGH
ncbi:MAG: 50S ribosomal protein L9 [Proteobacteria bacterium]|nr:MAG: 50S ribosomal protein L9 [Pseudomonadota bacterium]